MQKDLFQKNVYEKRHIEKTHAYGKRLINFVCIRKQGPYAYEKRGFNLGGLLLEVYSREFLISRDSELRFIEHVY